ncbi:MAG: hypothetical protein POH28_13760 [Acidocella sp.]|nr:hypothetical protein [Acidocella sp.]
MLQKVGLLRCVSACFELRDNMGVSTTLNMRSVRSRRLHRPQTDKVLAGLGSAALFFVGPHKLPPTKRRPGIEADWRAVGTDLAAAMKHREC